MLWAEPRRLWQGLCGPPSRGSRQGSFPGGRLVLNGASPLSGGTCLNDTFAFQPRGFGRVAVSLRLALPIS